MLRCTHRRRRDISSSVRERSAAHENHTPLRLTWSLRARICFLASLLCVPPTVALFVKCQILPATDSRYRFKFQSNLVWDSIKPISNFCFQFLKKPFNKILKLTIRVRYTVDLCPNPPRP